MKVTNGANLSFIPETVSCHIHFIEHEESLLPTVSIRVAVAILHFKVLFYRLKIYNSVLKPGSLYCVCIHFSNTKAVRSEQLLQ